MLEQSGSARVGIRLHEGEGHGSADIAAAVSGRRQVCGRGIRRREREFAPDRALRRPTWRAADQCSG